MNPEAFSGPNKISKVDLFLEKVNGFEPFIIFVQMNTVLNMSLEALTPFARSFILDV